MDTERKGAGRHEPRTGSAEHQVPPRASAGGEDDLLGVIADVEKQLEHIRHVRAERDDARQRLEARDAALTRREREVEDLALRVRSLQNEADQRRRELDEAQAGLESRQQEFEQARQREGAEAHKRASDLQAVAGTLDQREQRLAESAGALSRERATVDARATELARQQDLLNTARQELESRRAQIEKELEELSTQAANSGREARESAAEAARFREQFEAAQSRAQELSAQVAAAREAAAEECRRADDAAGSLEETRVQLERAGESQAALMTELGEKTRLLDEAIEHAADSDRQLTELQEQIQERDQRIQEISAKLGGAMDKLREVSRTLQEQGELVGQARAIESELREKDERVRSLEAQLAAASESAGDGAAGAELLARVEGLEEQLRAAGRELEDALEENRALGGQLREASIRRGPANDGGDGEAVLTRWRRLRLMRNLIQAQSEKVRQAGDALQQRYEQCEEVLAQRQEIMTARTAIGEARAKLERMQARAAKGKAAAMVFHAVATLAVLAGISWVAAGQFAPATYAVKAEIAADGRGQDITPEQLADWQEYHEGLLLDPQLIEVAAERLGRSGTVSLSTPGVLTQRLSADLSNESPAPGRISLELRGLGAVTTARTLETYLSAVVSQSNASRERRSDGLATIITQAPKALGAPISDQRPVFALVIFGAGFGVALLLGAVVWKRLAVSKVRFEEEQMVDSILDEANWQKSLQVLSRG